MQFNSFDGEKKRLFLEMYAKSPNITAAAVALGHSRALVFWHLERDPEFKKAFDEIREGITDQLEARVAEYGQRPQNFMDRIAWLRARRPEVWNPQQNINVTVDGKQNERLLGAAREYVDAEVVPPPSITGTPAK